MLRAGRPCAGWLAGGSQPSCEKVSSKRNTRSRMATTAQTAPRLGTTPALLLSSLLLLCEYGLEKMSRGRGDRTERLWVPVLLLLSSLKVRTASLPDRNQQSHTNNPASRSTTMSVTLLNACAVRAEDATSTVDGALLLVHFFPRCTVGAPTAAVVLRSMPQQLHAMADSAGSGNESKVTETTIGGRHRFC